MEERTQNEAKTWLQNNTSSAPPLAGNKFQSKEEATKFVEKLYELGAKEVLIDNIMEEEWRIQKDGGAYADSLIVKLPEEFDKRKGLFEFMNSELEDPEFEMEDKGQIEVLLWWD